MDLVLILVIIGEFVLVFPDRKVLIIGANSSSEDGPQYGPRPTISISGGSNPQNAEVTPSLSSEYYLWAGSGYSVFVIPANTIFIVIGLRLLFCKLNAELMKIFLMVDLMALYISSTMGLICYMIS
jgi:hypothetical protein